MITASIVGDLIMFNLFVKNKSDRIIEFHLSDVSVQVLGQKRRSEFIKTRIIEPFTTKHYLKQNEVLEDKSINSNETYKGIMMVKSPIQDIASVIFFVTINNERHSFALIPSI